MTESPLSSLIETSLLSPASERRRLLEIRYENQHHQRQLDLKIKLLSPSSPSSPSSSELLIIDKSKCRGDKIVCKFLDEFKAAKDSDVMISCAILFKICRRLYLVVNWSL
mmetsp:Transcript_19723/g.22038  ORF Transcript_19723/g.22038 Transcript_19723/m.22038 type:complete len:110 (+) Transcript_19723:172-501(+)